MKRLLCILFISALSFFPAACNSLNDSDTATVTIDTGIRATKAAAPSDVTSISVTVSGSGMATMTRSIPASTGIRTFEVPVGPARLFYVTAIGETFDYAGSTTQDIPEGGEVNISIDMIKQAGELNLTIPNQDGYTGTVLSFTVTVTIPETGGSIEATFPPSDAILMDVPPGNSREITIIATPLSTSAAVSFSTETTTADFTNGQSTNVSLSPTVTETKIVVPDANNSRIVQIDEDFQYPNWIAKDATSTIDGLYLLTISISMFTPCDIDFDSQGRIYIGNNQGTDGTIIRIDDITDTTPEKLSVSGGYNVTAIAIDRNNDDLIYFAAAGLLYSLYFDSTTATSITVPGWTFNSILGLAVDDNGNLYIAGNGPVGAGGPIVIQYNPSTTSVITYNTDLTTPWDVMVKSPYLYIANFNGAVADSQIIQLNLDSLGFVQGYGNYAISTAKGSFYGPHRFLAILNRKIYIADDDEVAGPSNAKIIAMDNINGDNWDTYGQWGYPADGTGYFRLWCTC